MPKVSVIVPVYNVEKYIGRCIESVLNQTLRDLELILVDDHGVDDSMSIVKRYSEQDSRIRYIESDENVGPMMAREKGYLSAVGDYLTFVDGDDRIPPDALEVMYKKAQETGADIISGNLVYITLAGKRIVWPNKLEHGGSIEGVYKALLTGDLIHNLCGKLFKRELLQNFRYDSFVKFTNGEDAYLFYEIVENIHHMVTIDEDVYHYLQTNSSSTQKRLSSQAVSNICRTNKLIHDIVSNYPTLRRDLYRTIERSLCVLYMRGYAIDTELTKNIKENNLEGYCLIKNIFKYNSFIESTKLLVMRYIWPRFVSVN